MKPSYEELEQKLIESERYGRQTDITIDNLEMKLAQMAAENSGLKAAIEYCINPDNQPEYHDQGMGCGVEDHGYQRDGYSACYYGWESAMERVYSEVIPDAIPETPATDAFLAEVRAQGVDVAIEHLINKFEGTGRIGVPIMALEWLSKELRKGVQS
ncbi:TPA: hNH endonuclease [Escherichia coli]